MILLFFDLFNTFSESLLNLLQLLDLLFLASKSINKFFKIDVLHDLELADLALKFFKSLSLRCLVLAQSDPVAFGLSQIFFQLINNLFAGCKRLLSVNQLLF